MEAGVKTSGMVEWLTGVEVWFGIRIGAVTEDEKIEEGKNSLDYDTWGRPK